MSHIGIYLFLIFVFGLFLVFSMFMFINLQAYPPTIQKDVGPGLFNAFSESLSKKASNLEPARGPAKIEIELGNNTQIRD